jgi:hypothetical protein
LGNKYSHGIFIASVGMSDKAERAQIATKTCKTMVMVFNKKVKKN